MYFNIQGLQMKKTKYCRLVFGNNLQYSIYLQYLTNHVFSTKYQYISTQKSQFRSPATKCSDSWTKTHRPNTLQYTIHLRKVAILKQYNCKHFLRHCMSHSLWFIFPTHKSALTKHTQQGPKVSGLTYKSRAKWKML